MDNKPLALNAKRMSRGKKIALALSALAVALIVCAWLALGALTGGWSSFTLLKTVASPDGKYVATVIDEDDGAFGGSSTLEVTYRKKPGLLTRLSHLFDTKYSETLDQITDIRWTGRRTLQVRYWGFESREPPTQWWDVRIDNEVSSGPCTICR